MLVKDLGRIAFLVIPCALAILLCLELWYAEPWSPMRAQVSEQAEQAQQAQQNPSSDASVQHGDAVKYHNIFSLTTRDGRYMNVDFGGVSTYNPNLIPHPNDTDKWILVGQKNTPDDRRSVFFQAVGCNATFADGRLGCVSQPEPLPIAATGGDRCRDEYAYMNYNVGPHDPRVFYGPERPYTIFGSNGAATPSCFSVWMQDFRVLFDWGFELFAKASFRIATELHRPPPYGFMEKNYFVFWAMDDTSMYAHYDIAPRRSFARLALDGSVGPDLAPQASSRGDDACLARYLPRLAPENESIHQATNSLSVTLCRRADPACTPDQDNTFVMAIFQHKIWLGVGGVYEPYVMLFRRRDPFELHAISLKPLWIHGRRHTEAVRDMMYVTSFSWKNHGQRYHGFLDDPVFIGFGINDRLSAGIDLLAGDLLTEMGLCQDSGRGVVI